MAIEKFTFYASTIEEINWITKHLKKLPKETLKSLESIEDIGIDSSASVKNLIRIYPITGEINRMNCPTNSNICSKDIRFKYRGIEYMIFKQPPFWLKNPNS